jgi:hypothetical protein
VLHSLVADVITNAIILAFIILELLLGVAAVVSFKIAEKNK